MADPAVAPNLQRIRAGGYGRAIKDSDLTVIPFAFGAILSILVVLAAFFFVGPIAGVVVLLVVLVAAGVLAGRWILAEDESE